MSNIKNIYNTEDLIDTILYLKELALSFNNLPNTISIARHEDGTIYNSIEELVASRTNNEDVKIVNFDPHFEVTKHLKNSAQLTQKDLKDISTLLSSFTIPEEKKPEIIIKEEVPQHSDLEKEVIKKLKQRISSSINYYKSVSPNPTKLEESIIALVDLYINHNIVPAAHFGYLDLYHERKKLQNEI